MSDRTTTANAGGNESTGAGPEEQAATAVLKDLESLRSRVTVAEQQRDEYLALLQRTRADFENYQKRIRARSRRRAALHMRTSSAGCSRSWITCNGPWRRLGSRESRARWSRG